MLNDKKRYENLTRGHRFSYSQFNVWMMFFVVINGGLLLAYSSEGLKDSDWDKMLILVVGYIASILFYCSCNDFRHSIKHFYTLIYYYEITNMPHILAKENLGVANIEKENSCYKKGKDSKISTTRIVSLFALILAYAWGILIVSKFCDYIGIRKCIVSEFCDSMRTRGCMKVSLLFYKFMEVISACFAITVINMLFIRLVNIFAQSCSPWDRDRAPITVNDNSGENSK